MLKRTPLRQIKLQKLSGNQDNKLSGKFKYWIHFKESAKFNGSV